MHLSIPYYTTLVERLARVLSAGGLLVMAESEPFYVSYLVSPSPISADREAINIWSTYAS